MERVARIDCPHCKTTLEIEDAYFRELAGKQFRCPNCKKFIPMPRVCPQCQRECESDAAFCPACGSDLSGKKPLKLQASAQATPSPPALNSRYQCPYCGNLLALGTRVCAICRMDLRTGKPIGHEMPTGDESGCLMAAGWVFALLGGWLGIILGIVVIVRGKRVGSGIAMIIVSILSVIFWLMILGVLGGLAS